MDKSGVPEARAEQFTEAKVEFLADGDGRIRLRATNNGQQLLSGGTSLEHHEHFARRLHLRNAAVPGGNPEPLGDDPGPPHEGNAERNVRVQATISAISDAARGDYRRNLAPQPEAAHRITRADPATAF